MSQIKGIGRNKEVWGRGNNGNRYMSACASAEMLDLTMEFVSFFKSLMMRMNTKTIQLFITYEDMDREVNLLLYA